MASFFTYDQRLDLQKHLKKAYLKTLSVGTHDVEMVWKGGSAKTTLTIVADVPATGDSSNMAVWLAILAFAAAVMLIAVRRRRAI